MVAHQNRLNFELAYFYLVVTLSPRRGRRSTVENIPPSSLHNAPDIANYFAFILPPPLSLSLSPFQSLNSRLVGRRKEFTSFARGTKGEEKEVEEFRARWLHRLQDKSWRCAPKLAVKGICQINFHGPMNTSLPSLNNVQADNK